MLTHLWKLTGNRTQTQERAFLWCKGVDPFAENEVQNTLLSNYQSFGVVWYSEQLLLIFLVPPL